jgi:pimeloyl-ACP methyl ester carboxylesterase
MFDVAPVKRRRFLQTAVLGAAGLTAAEFGRIETVAAETASASNRSTPSALTALQPIRQVHAGVLDIGYFEAGPSDGQAVLLLHGFPYDIHSYVEVAPMLAAKGYRVIVPHLRGRGTTRFLEAATLRAGQQGAIGADVIALMDALNIPSAVLAGYDWGGRAACVAAALWPERCKGLVSVNGYLIQDIAHAATPIPAKIETSIISRSSAAGKA